jgi:hypothetical protein
MEKFVMNKKIFVILVVILVISAMAIPAFAGPPDDSVEGRWCYYPTIYEVTKTAGGNTFFNLDDNGAWIGTFEGFSSDDGISIVHPSGYTIFKTTVSFDSPVKVGDQTYNGELEMRVNGWLPVGGDLSKYEGLWVITKATGELKGLVGQGTWGGVEIGNPDCSEGFFLSVPYSGNLHFEN